MRTNEYLHILQDRFGAEDVRIETTETGTEWGTTWYEVHAWIESDLLKYLRPQGLIREYKKEGIAMCLDSANVFSGKTIDEVIEDLFMYCFDEGMLN